MAPGGRTMECPVDDLSPHGAPDPAEHVDSGDPTDPAARTELAEAADGAGARGAAFYGETRVEGDAVAGDKFVITTAEATQPGQLPRDDPCFRGRRAVLDELDALHATGLGE